MKKKLFLILTAFMCICGAVMAQSELHTYSVYDVNHQDGVSVADATQVVSRALEKIQEDPQVVTAEELNAAVQLFNQLLQQNNALLNALSSRIAIIEQSIKSLPEGNVEDPFNGHDYVDLGVKDDYGRTIYWATCNLGANVPHGYGYYYAWGETEPHATNTYFAGEYNYSDNPQFLPMSNDAARVNWQGQWRMPQYGEFRKLYESCKWEYTYVGGILGYKVSSKTDSSKWIFLPCAGQIVGKTPTDVGLKMYYWTSQIRADDASCAICYDGTSATRTILRSQGCPIRPVCVLPE